MWNEVLVVYFKRAAQDFVEGNKKIKKNIRQEIPPLGLNSKVFTSKTGNKQCMNLLTNSSDSLMTWFESRVSAIFLPFPFSL